MNGQKRIAIAAVFILIVVIVGVVIAGHKPGVAISQRYIVPTTFDSSAAFGPNTLVTSNGQAIISYNYVTGQVQSLSQSNGPENLSAIISLSASSDHKYVLFHLQNVLASSTLGAKLTTAGLNPAEDHWWILNTNTHSLVPLPDPVTLAVISGDTVYGLVYDNNGIYMNTYNSDTAKRMNSISVPAATNFAVLHTGYLLQTAAGNIVLTKDGIVSTQIYKKANLVGVSPDQQSMFITVANNSLVSLLQVRLSDSTPTTIADSVVGVPVMNGDTVLYGTAGDQSSVKNNTDLHTYNMATGKTLVLNFAGNIAPKAGTDPAPISLVGNSTLIYSDTSAKYYLAGNNLHTLPSGL